VGRVRGERNGDSNIREGPRLKRGDYFTFFVHETAIETIFGARGGQQGGAIRREVNRPLEST